MSSSRSLSPLAPPALLGLGLATTLFLVTGCNDSVACVFTTGCQSGPGALSSNEAVPPLDGDWILDGAPTVVEVFPSGINQASTTPIVVVFSETMVPSTLAGAIEVVTLFGGLPSTPVTGLQQFLVGDGRVLVLLAGIPLMPGDYQIQVGQMAAATDLVGQALSESRGTRLGGFSVPATDPAAPRVVATYPADGAVDQSEIGQVVVVLDRPVRASTVTGTSLDVRVGGADPANDPPAVPLGVGGAVTDTRVYLYRSVDGDGRPAALGTDASVEVRVSVGNAILSEADGAALPLETVTFRTLPFSAPLSGALLSDPHDAIGRRNLTAGDAEELEIEVTLDMLQTGDVVDLYLFGTQRTQLPDPPTIALRRSRTLTAATPVSSVLFGLAQLDLLLSADPGDVRFADGALAIGMSARRGTRVSPITLLDLDPDPRVIQDPILDTTMPVIEDLLVPGGGLDFVTDLRDVSIAGKADGPVRVAEVDAPPGNNGAMRVVVGSRADGSFLAGPVPLGVISGGTTTYTLKVFDGAFNPSTTVSGSVTQVGVVGPDPLVPGQPVSVHVHDAETLEPIQGALAIMHGDAGDGVNYPFVQAGITLEDGRIPLLTAAAPSVAALLTVENPGYDLFSLHGVMSTAVSVPLHRSNRGSARARGLVQSTEAGVIARLPLLDLRYDDSRRDFELARGFQGVACDDTVASISCAYGPETIADGRLGARTFFAGDFTQNEGAFSAALLLQAFAIDLPFDRVAPNGLQTGNLEVPLLLLDTADPSEEAAATPAVRLRVDPASGVNLASLVPGGPAGTVETRVHGLPGSVALGAALAYDQGGDVWRFLGARPGASTAAGALAMALDTDASVRMEVRDTAGNVAGARPRLAQIQAAGLDPEFQALDVPTVLAPLAGASSNGQAFDVVLRHVIDDGRGMAGLYHVRLLDDLGRGWDLWRVDPSGTADVHVRAADPVALGGTGLADGPIVLEASAWAWTGLSPGSFLWTDLERDFELYSQAARFTFDKP